jgi:Aspartyl protease
MRFPLNAPAWALWATTFSITTIVCRAESRCPGNVPGLRPRIVAGALLVIPVKVNDSGPYDFMVDTGSQLNVVDPSLAAELKLKSQGPVGLVATATRFESSVAVLDSLQAGSRVVAKPLVAIQDLGSIQAADPRIRGVLGESFLAHFDLLIDYRHPLLCLDDASKMQEEVRGERIPLVPPAHPESELPYTQRLVISVEFSDTGAQQILLQLDSGSDGPILYSDNEKLEDLLGRAKPHGADANEAQRAFALLPPQDMRVGTRTIRKVPFVTPARATQNLPDRAEDGILATVLFQRLYINHTGRYVIFNPR